MRERLERRRVGWATALVFLVSLAVYGATCARTVTLVDSGELIVVCATLGVAHPPGFPVYTMIGHLFSRVPIGSVAFRLSFMSGFFAAVTAALLVLIVHELKAAPFIDPDQGGTQRKPSTRRSRSRPWRDVTASSSPRWRTAVDLLLPVSVGLTFAFSATLWSYATVAEVYSLNLALLAAVFWLLLSWRRRRHHQSEQSRASRWLIPLAALLYGLALGVHHATVVLLFPAMFVFVWRTAGRSYLMSRPARLAVAAVLIGLSSYVYLPLAAARDPSLNWGDPSSWQRFWWHVSARQYQVNLFSGSLAQVFDNLGTFLRWWLRQFTPAGFLIALLGLGRLWRRDRTSLWLLLLVMLCGVGYAINYQIAEDTDAYYLTTFLATAMALGAGLWRLRDWAERRRATLVSAVVVLAAALPVMNLALHYRENDRHDSHIARNYVEDALAGVAPGGLLMTLDWQLYSPFLYLRHIEGFRPDVTVVDVNLVRRSWYVRGYLNRVYPEMMAACKTRQDAFLDKLRLFEYNQPYDPNEITARFTDLLNAFIDHHLPQRQAHLTIPMEANVGAGYNWVPSGLAFRLYPDRELHLDPPPSLHLEPLLSDSEPLDEVARLKVRPAYALMIAHRGRYLATAGRYDEAMEQLNLALKLQPHSDTIHQFIGDLELARGRREAAITAYQKALRLNPDNIMARQRLQTLSAGGDGQK